MSPEWIMAAVKPRTRTAASRRAVTAVSRSRPASAAVALETAAAAARLSTK